jgi:hypothetical protein
MGEAMSAHGIGADTATVDTTGKRVNTAQSNAPATIVKWIPGEAVTFYAAIIGLGSAQGELTGDETPQELLERIDAGSFSWFLLGAFIACALVVIGSLAAPREAGTRPSKLGIFVRLVLAVAAFALWTSALPGAWPYSLHFIRDLGAAHAILLVPLGIVFAAAAEWVTRKVAL